MKVDQEQVMQSSRAAQGSSISAKLGTAGALDLALRQKQEMGEQASAERAGSLAEEVAALKGDMAEVLHLLKQNPGPGK